MTAPIGRVIPSERSFTGDRFTGTTLSREPLESDESAVQRARVWSNARVAAALQRLNLRSSYIYEEPSTTPRPVAYLAQCYLLSSVIRQEPSSTEQIFDTILAFYVSGNRTRDRQIAKRITQLYRDALAEEERILADSLEQFRRFFLEHPELALPKIALTPDGTLHAYWVHGPGNFVAIEFTGQLVVKVVAEIPRDGVTARHFSTDAVQNVVSTATALGASFT